MTGPRRSLAVDGSVAALLLAGLLLADAWAWGVAPAGPFASGLRVVGIAGVAAALLFRRAFPLRTLAATTAAAALTTALGGPPQAAFGVALAAYSAARIADRPRRWVPPAVSCVVVAAANSVGGAPGGLAAMIAGSAVVGVGWFAGEATRERGTRIAATAERRAERERRQLAAAAQAATDERLVIARELHDVVAHAMSVIAVRAGVARMVMDTDPAEVREALAIIETTTRRALQEMRLLVGVLRQPREIDAELMPSPGMADVPNLVQQIRRAGVDVSLDVRGRARPLPAGADMSAYRIVQEALTNVVRHAGPTKADLRIHYRPEEIAIQVTDAGPAARFAPKQDDVPVGAGHGLIGMGERVALFGGRLAAGRSGSGFKVDALLRTEEPS